VVTIIAVLLMDDRSRSDINDDTTYDRVKVPSG
jgi:hypothetical protein